jgi:hypothetical protein
MKNAATTAPATWTFVKVTDEVTTCDVCGREELRSTTLFRSADGELYAGSECARKVTGFTTKDVRAAATAAAQAERNASAAASSAASAIEHAAICAHFGVADVLEVPRSARKAFLAGR